VWRPGAGDYVAYRVAFDATTTDASCYSDNMIPDDKKDDVTTFMSGGTFILYLDADGTPLLDIGTLVVEGSETDAGYTFSGNSVDVDYLNNNPNDTNVLKITQTTTVTIDMTVDGDTISGTSKTVTDQKCEGTACPMDFAKSCTRTGSYKGVELDEVDVALSGGSSSGGNP